MGWGFIGNALGKAAELTGLSTPGNVPDPYKVDLNSVGLQNAGGLNQRYADISDSLRNFNTNDTRGQQQGLANTLAAQSQSTDTIGSRWMKQQGDQAARQAQALMLSQRGVNPALAAREGAYAGGAAQLQAAQQAAIMGAQERQMAQQSLGNVLGNMRTGDMDTESMRTQGQLNAVGGMDTLAAQQLAAQLQAHAINSGSVGQMAGIQQQGSIAEMNNRQKFLGGLAQAAGVGGSQAAAAMSKVVG